MKVWENVNTFCYLTECFATNLNRKPAADELKDFDDECSNESKTL